MSLRIDSRHSATVSTQASQEPVPPNQFNRFSDSSSTVISIGAMRSSCLDRLWTWLASLWSSLMKSFSSINTRTPNNPTANNPVPNQTSSGSSTSIAPVSTAPASIARTPGSTSSIVNQGRLTDSSVFKVGDYNFQGYTANQKKELAFAENCCGFPKLALYLFEKHAINTHIACQKINRALFRAPGGSEATELTAQFVLQNG